MLTRAGLASVSALTLLAMSGMAVGQAIDTFTPVPAPGGQQPAAAAGPVTLPDGTVSASKVEFKEMQFDFGRISDQGTVTTKFHFKNNGTGKLVFKESQKASCGCTAGKPKNMSGGEQLEFAPGEEGFIELSFDAHGKRGDVQQILTIQSYDPHHQPEGPVLTVRAKVKPTITFDPPSVGFGDVMAGQTRKEIIRINGAKPDFAVEYLSTTKGRYVTARVLDTKEVEVDGEKVGQSTVELTFNTGNLPRGNFNAQATIRTNDPAYWLADFPITASIVGDLQVLPPRLNVGIIEVNQPFSKTFRVSSRSGKPFKINKIDQRSSTGAPLEVSFAPVEAGNESAYIVTVKGAGIANPMAINSSLTIVTDSETDPILDMVLSGAVRGSQAAPSPTPSPAPAVYTPMQTPTSDTPR
ncbi:MAG: DUF1573 domain-containing protein [Phycisphaeraceae bacterium]|nr:DUF1573 domain-containing protein [Phycisphaeraceae bacterium]